jgi:DNA-binding transcriptional LysR family regulator
VQLSASAGIASISPEVFHSEMNESSASSLTPALAQLAALGLDPNITRAAERTGTSQPTLSRSLRAWELDLGIHILERHGRTVVLTDEGRILAAAAADALERVDVALQRIRGTRAANSVAVGFLRSLGPTVAGELIAAFLDKSPGVLITHREGSGVELLDALDEGRVDVAITAPKPPERFGWLPVGRQAFVLVVPRGHDLAEAEAVDVADVRGEPFLVLDRRFDARQRADALCAAAGFSPRVVLEADDLTTVRGYVAAGLGIAILPADGALSPRTVSVRLADANATRAVGLAWSKERTSLTAVALIEFTKELTRKYPGWADVLE